mgnify:FL=1
MPSKFEFNKGKMVPYPSGAIVPDRDLGQRRRSSASTWALSLAALRQ